MRWNSTEFQRQGQIPLAWLNKSTDLRASAAALWASMDDETSKSIVTRFELGIGFGSGFRMDAAVPGIFRMLCGLSLELLYKAIIVSKGASAPKGHNLFQLAQRAGIVVSKEDRGLLEIPEYIVWSGRYPVPQEVGFWNKLVELSHKYLYRRVPFGKLQLQTGNDALSWDGFDRLWCATVVSFEYKGAGIVED